MDGQDAVAEPELKPAPKKPKKQPPATALVPVAPGQIAQSLDGLFDREVIKFAEMAVASGAWSNIKDVSEALVKIQVGRDIGLKPTLALSQVYLVNGVPTFAAQYIAAQVKRSRPRYNYRPLEATYEKFVLQFYEDGAEWGTWEYTIQDAEKAGLTRNDTWRKFRKSMLFARCLTGGVRVYCPDVLGGVTAYTPDELGGDMAPEDKISDAEFTAK